MRCLHYNTPTKPTTLCSQAGGPTLIICQPSQAGQTSPRMNFFPNPVILKTGTVFYEFSILDLRDTNKFCPVSRLEYADASRYQGRRLSRPPGIPDYVHLLGTILTECDATLHIKGRYEVQVHRSFRIPFPWSFLLIK
jgi:hypothetical protein